MRGLLRPARLSIALVILLVAHTGLDAFSAAAEIHRDIPVAVVSNPVADWSIATSAIQLASGTTKTATGLVVVNDSPLDADTIDVGLQTDPAGLLDAAAPDPFFLGKGASQAISLTVNATGVAPGAYAITLTLDIQTGAGRVFISNLTTPVDVT